MSINIDLTGVSSDAKKVKRQALDLSNQRIRLASIEGYISHRVKNRNHIQSRLSSCLNKVNQLSQEAEQLRYALDNAVGLYTTTELENVRYGRNFDVMQRLRIADTYVQMEARTDKEVNRLNALYGFLKSVPAFGSLMGAMELDGIDSIYNLLEAATEAVKVLLAHDKIKEIYALKKVVTQASKNGNLWDMIRKSAELDKALDKYILQGTPFMNKLYKKVMRCGKSMPKLLKLGFVGTGEFLSWRQRSHDVYEDFSKDKYFQDMSTNEQLGTTLFSSAMGTAVDFGLATLTAGALGAAVTATAPVSVSAVLVSVGGGIIYTGVDAIVEASTGKNIGDHVAAGVYEAKKDIDEFVDNAGKGFNMIKDATADKMREMVNGIITPIRPHFDFKPFSFGF